MNTLTDLIGGNDAAWMSAPGRPCASPIDAPEHIRDHADNWYPREKYYDEAAKLCTGCPVQTQCLQYALDNNEDEGVWGGTTPANRSTLRRRAYRETETTRATA